jgi:hypothetical protein
MKGPQSRPPTQSWWPRPTDRRPPRRTGRGRPQRPIELSSCTSKLQLTTRHEHAHGRAVRPSPASGWSGWTRIGSRYDRNPTDPKRRRVVGTGAGIVQRLGRRLTKPQMQVRFRLPASPCPFLNARLLTPRPRLNAQIATRWTGGARSSGRGRGPHRPRVGGLDPLTADHLIARVEGGRNVRSNMSAGNAPRLRALAVNSREPLVVALRVLDPLGHEAVKELGGA